MEETVFTVDQAASILDCKRSMVYDLIKEGWLSRPAGTSKKETGGRVTQKSLFKFMVVDRLSRVPLRVLKKLKREREFLSSFASKNAKANWISIGEGRAEANESAVEPADPSPYPLPQGEGKQRQLHHAFVEQHQFSFRWRAWQLAPRDLAMQDDLVQEMSLVVLEYDKPASFEFLFGRATDRAKNYLKYEALRGMLSLSEARHVSDASAEKIDSLRSFIDSLIERGVPAEWIDEVIGERVDIA